MTIDNSSDECIIFENELKPTYLKQIETIAPNERRTCIHCPIKVFDNTYDKQL